MKAMGGKSARKVTLRLDSARAAHRKRKMGLFTAAVFTTLGEGPFWVPASREG